MAGNKLHLIVGILVALLFVAGVILLKSRQQSRLIENPQEVAFESSDSKPVLQVAPTPMVNVPQDHVIVTVTMDYTNSVVVV